MNTTELLAPRTLTVSDVEEPQIVQELKPEHERAPIPQSNSLNPLLNIPIAKRLALGFLTSACIASISLLITGLQKKLLFPDEPAVFFVTVLAIAGNLLGISIIGWLISSTLVPRLQRLRSVVQSLEKGQINAHPVLVGHDEITDISLSVHVMSDTIAGLLEETRRQRVELANARELQRRHQELQSKHEALNQANSRLEALAATDPLIGLPNNRAIMNHIDEELSRCRRTQERCAILFVDIDHFKLINDTWGHRAGDAVLREIGKRLSNNIRLEDFVGRYGGEEFAIVLTNSDTNQAKQAAERLRLALADKPCLWETEEDNVLSVIAIPVTASLGVATYLEHGITRDALIQAADSAMYHAKQSGRNRVCIAGEEILDVQDLFASAPNELRVSDSMAVQALTAVANAHDRGTSAHSQRMVQLAEATAQILKQSEEEIYLIRLAALLHDIGKIGIPDAILHKPGPLTEDEWAVMRNHPEIGRQILVQAGGKFESISHIVVGHHEHWDGSGYPSGLAQEAIPLGARILSVVDSYDAMVSKRPYRDREPKSPSEARAELQRYAGQLYDPEVVKAFLRVLDEQERPGSSLRDSSCYLPSCVTL